MGTWEAPDTKLKQLRLKKLIKLLKVLEKQIASVFGDDIVMDLFDEIEDRLEWALKVQWDKPSRTRGPK